MSAQFQVLTEYDLAVRAADAYYAGHYEWITRTPLPDDVVGRSHPLPPHLSSSPPLRSLPCSPVLGGMHAACTRTYEALKALGPKPAPADVERLWPGGTKLACDVCDETVRRVLILSLDNDIAICARCIDALRRSFDLNSKEIP